MSQDDINNPPDELVKVLYRLADSNESIADGLKETAASHNNQANSRMDEREKLNSQILSWGENITLIARAVKDSSEQQTKDVNMLCTAQSEQGKIILEQGKALMSQHKETNDNVKLVAQEVRECTSALREHIIESQYARKEIDSIKKQSDKTDDDVDVIEKDVSSMKTQLKILGAGLLAVIPISSFILNLFKQASS